MGNLIQEVVQKTGNQYRGRQGRTFPEVAEDQPEIGGGFKGGRGRGRGRGGVIMNAQSELQRAKEATQPEPMAFGDPNAMQQAATQERAATGNRGGAGASARMGMQQQMADAQAQARQPIGPGSQWSPEQQEQWRGSRGNPHMRNMMTQAHQQSQSANSGRAPPRMSSMAQQQGYADQMRTRPPNPTGRRIGSGGGGYG